MNSFEYHLPTKIIFGKGAEEKVGAEIASRGVKRVLIVYGGGSVVKSGLLGRVEKSLADAGIAYVSKGGVRPNPLSDFVYETLDDLKSDKIDFDFLPDFANMNGNCFFARHGRFIPHRLIYPVG